jgi:transcription elongation factor GreA
LNKTVYVTPKGKIDLEKELDQLRNHKRPRIIERLHEVKTGADWMENTEQQLFEDELSFVDRRIQDLETMLANAEIIGPDKDLSMVSIGDTVVLEDEDDEIETYTIVGVAEADPSRGYISNESPVGKAVLGRKVGDSVSVKTPSGERQVRIVALT